MTHSHYSRSYRFTLFTWIYGVHLHQSNISLDWKKLKSVEDFLRDNCWMKCGTCPWDTTVSENKWWHDNTCLIVCLRIPNWVVQKPQLIYRTERDTALQGMTLFLTWQSAELNSGPLTRRKSPLKEGYMLRVAGGHTVLLGLASRSSLWKGEFIYIFFKCLPTPLPPPSIFTVSFSICKLQHRRQQFS